VSYHVEINSSPAELEVPNRSRLARLARAVLANEGAPAGEVGIVLTDDAGIQQLNRQYLGHDEPTDVISWGELEDASGQPELLVPAGERPYIGDVAISIERAREQAPNYGHDWSDEVDTLLVHGLLHLLGYDDLTDGARQLMFARQERLLAIFEKPQGMLGIFRAAGRGLLNVWATQPNLRIHLAISAVVLLAGALLGIERWEWAALVLTIALVLVAETLNTAIEAAVDLASPEIHPLAGRAKDAASAAVLLAALLAVAIGAIVFVPHLWALAFAP
jgi:rRNA maturation RNase YbeY